jgi:uncharacterized protein involved in exopolysaccharide biosynthesis
VTVLVYLLPQSFPATALILVELNKHPTLRAEAPGYPLKSDSVIGSEVEILTSRRLAEAVVDDLRLHERPQQDTQLSRLIAAVVDFLDRNGLVPRLERRERVIQGIQKALDVRQPGLADLLSVTYAADDALYAHEVATALVEHYLLLHREIHSIPAAAFYQARLAEIEADLAKVRAARERNTERSARATLDLHLQAAESSYLFYRERLDRARANDAADLSLVNVQVVDWPSVPAQPRFTRLILILLAFVAGCVLAVPTALLIDYFDHRVYAPRDVESHLDVPVLGSISRLGWLARIRTLP